MDYQMFTDRKLSLQHLVQTSSSPMMLEIACMHISSTILDKMSIKIKVRKINILFEAIPCSFT